VRGGAFAQGGGRDAVSFDAASCRSRLSSLKRSGVIAALGDDTDSGLRLSRSSLVWFREAISRTNRAKEIKDCVEPRLPLKKRISLA